MSSRRSRPSPKAQSKLTEAMGGKPNISEGTPLSHGVTKGKNRVVARVLSYNPRTRLMASMVFGIFCLTGLWMTDYIEKKYPPTEEQLQKARDSPWWKLDIPHKSHFEQARAEAQHRKELAAQETKQR